MRDDESNQMEKPMPDEHEKRARISVQCSDLRLTKLEGQFKEELGEEKFEEIATIRSCLVAMQIDVNNDKYEPNRTGFRKKRKREQDEPLLGLDSNTTAYFLCVVSYILFMVNEKVKTGECSGPEDLWEAIETFNLDIHDILHRVRKRARDVAHDAWEKCPHVNQEMPKCSP